MNKKFYSKKIVDIAFKKPVIQMFQTSGQWGNSGCDIAYGGCASNWQLWSWSARQRIKESQSG